jgi:hypothetical protein
MFQILTDTDIKNNKFVYDSETIEWNIINSCLSLRTLVRYQKLTPYICAKYVVFGGKNGQYADCSEDSWIDTYDVLRLQPHITLEDMLNAYKLVDENN